jgi:hypothetical protein
LERVKANPNSKMKNLIIKFVLILFIGQLGCSQGNNLNEEIAFNKQENKSKSKMNIKIDTFRRNRLVEKYNLLKFSNLKQPVFITLDEFFIGNNDEASIAPNLDKKLLLKEYYKILKALADNHKTLDAFAEIKDVNIYENGKLGNDEWFYTDMIYFVGDLTKDEIKEATKSLFPDEVEYDTENKISILNKKYKDKKVVYLWWD